MPWWMRSCGLFAIQSMYHHSLESCFLGFLGLGFLQGLRVYLAAPWWLNPHALEQDCWMPCAETSTFCSPGGSELFGTWMHIIKHRGSWETRNGTSFGLLSLILPGELIPFFVAFLLSSFSGILRCYGSIELAST